MNKSALLSIVLLLSYLVSAAQKHLDSLLIRQYQNIEHLYMRRGGGPWSPPKADMDTSDISWRLNRYSKNVGLIIYTAFDDHLRIDFFGKNGLYRKRDMRISKSELIKKVDRIAMYFSSGAGQRAGLKRGGIAGNIAENVFLRKKEIEIFSNLLLPFKEEIGDLNHLIIVPAINIALVPFSALPLKEGKFLIDKMSYSIAPSLYEMGISDEHNRDKLNNYYNESTFRYQWQNALFISNPLYDTVGPWNFPDLPNADKEVDSITALFATKYYTRFSGEQATIDSLLKNICEYDLLYFATHGIANPQSAVDSSFIALAPNQDGLSKITARDIMNLRNYCKLKSDLVVLSACQTGMGQTDDGGIIGLARSFQIAGAHHVLMSLWNIDDKETAELMTLFMKNLLQANYLMPHEALRQAILDYKNRPNANPKYWGAFTIFGVPY